MTRLTYMRGASRRRSGWLLVVLAIGATLVGIELAVRVVTGSLFSGRSKEGGDYADVLPLVGRIPRAGISVRHPAGFDINIGANGTRWNGRDPPRADRPRTLVLGDSFAFGDGVDDEDSWPAMVERMSGRPVVNAAVPGFGLDQAVLRAEQLAPVYAPDIVVVSFIPHDVLRCEMSWWSGHPKPYFDLDAQGMHLHPAPAGAPAGFRAVKRLASWSRAAELLFPQLNWEGPEEVVVHRKGRQVACRLMEHLARLGRTRQAVVVVLAQPQEPTATAEQLEIKDRVLACARDNRLLALDLFPVVEGLPPAQRTALFPRHMSAEGNRIVAAEVNAFLNRQAIPAPTPGIPVPAGAIPQAGVDAQ